ncbi:MAG: glycoside hydrolase family 3 C-terminal domain-containing protein [Gemmatimonadota bacterium]|nr:glycoside hydrolase family 3 C-terminal domain-containing protein [Gemmatimonadota bacterium]
MRSLQRVVLVALVSARAAVAQSPDPRVEALLRRMTLEEKVGEMTQLDISAVTQVTGTATRAQVLDSAKLEEIVVKRNVGSLLNVAGVALTPKQWTDITTMIQRFAQRRRVPVPVLYGIDAVHGHQYMLGATIFPQNLAMAATWNPMLVRRANQITAYETRASGIRWNFSPVLDLARQPLWSRFFETFGEDVYLTSVLGREAIEAEQASPVAAVDSLLAGRSMSMLSAPIAPAAGARGFTSTYVAATGKHFIGYSMPLSGRDRTSAWLPERQLRELFLPPFQAAIDAGVRTIMANSGEVNGVPVHSSRELLTDLLRTELGFRGVVVSDWEDINRLVTVTHVARTRRDAVRMSINAGIDMSMVPYNTLFIDDVLDLVHSGDITEARIDESVRRILKLKVDLGLFEAPGPDTARLANAGSSRFAAVSRRAAEEAVTLVKNDRGVLPLASGVKLLVTGPGATSLPVQHGGWTYTWQGTDTAMYPKSVPTLLTALRTQFGADRVTYAEGSSLTKVTGIAAAVAAARDADVIIVALGEPPVVEKPGDIDDLALPDAQLALTRAMEATGKPVILTVFESRPRTIRTAVDSARGIVLGYLTGPFGGEAIARVLAGDVNPSGRLPFSYPKNAAAIEHYDRTASGELGISGPTGGYNPEWEFGYGLSYTTFAYDSVSVAKGTLGVRDTVSVSVAVTNTGKRAGMEVVQVYSRQLYASVTPAMRRLRAFEKVLLAPGERRMVTFRIPVQRLGFVGRDNRFVVETGDFELMVGGKMAKLVIE